MTKDQKEVTISHCFYSHAELKLGVSENCMISPSPFAQYCNVCIVIIPVD